MIAFLKKNGAWLLLAVIMLTLLLCLPLIEKDPKIGIAFEFIVENHTKDFVDGISINWTVGEKEGKLDYVNFEDLVRFPVKVGGEMVVQFTDEMLDGQSLPAAMHGEFAVLATLNSREHEIGVEGVVDLDVDSHGEYVLVLEGAPGSYTIRLADEQPEPKKK